MGVWVNKVFEIDGEDVEIDYPTYETLNVLAAKFYRVLGYETQGIHDFFKSPHPQENRMFNMALVAYAFNLSVGLD